mmetsp:Transcript_7224/g.16963  ORF Transcript_7224/g.16963 Transcript_7224/m.16963 type:complete len:253 (+) Transcript_7224:366-1124(+)
MIAHFVVRNYQRLVRVGDMKPEPIVVHSPWCLVQVPVVHPFLFQPPKVVWHHVLCKVSLVQYNKYFFPHFRKVLDDPVNLNIINVFRSSGKVLVKTSNVGAINDHVNVSNEFQEFGKPVPLHLTFFWREVHFLFPFLSPLELCVVSFHLSVSDNLLVHISHFIPRPLRNVDWIQLAPFQASSLECTAFHVNWTSRTYFPCIDTHDWPHTWRRFFVACMNLVQILADFRHVGTSFGESICVERVSQFKPFQYP